MHPNLTTMHTRPKQHRHRMHSVGRFFAAGVALTLGLGSLLLSTASSAQDKADAAPVTSGPPGVTPKAPGPVPTAPPMSTSKTSVLQGHNNAYNTGENYTETILTPTSILTSPTNVSSGKFGKLFTRPLDGAVYAQPLYVPNVYYSNIPYPYLANPSLPGSYHNTVYVVTENNSIYAWDADDNLATNIKPLWYKSFNFPSLLIGPISTDEVGTVDISPQISITGTPIITTAVNPNTKGTTGVIYFVSAVHNGNEYYQYIHALDITTGNELYGGPTLINATVVGAGDGSILDVDQFGNPILDNNGNFIFLLPFNALNENQQAALKMLSDGTLVICWGGHGEINPLHGWIMTYKPNAGNTALVQTGVFCLSPNGTEDANGVPAGAGVWAGGAGPVIDKYNDIFVSTGIGAFNIDQGGTEYGESVLKVNFGVGSPNTVNSAPLPNYPVVDYFTPADWQTQNLSFSDLGSGAPILISDGVGPASSPNLLVAAGIEGTIYVLNRSASAPAQTLGFILEGGFNAGQDSQIVQELIEAVGPVYGAPAYSTPNRTLFYQGTGDVLTAFSFGSNTDDPTNYGYLPVTPTATAPSPDIYGKTGNFDYPGSTVSITGDGINFPSATPGNTLIWTLEKQNVPPPVNDFFDIGGPNTPNFFYGAVIPYPALPDGPPLAVLHAYDGNPAHWTNGVIPQVYSGLAAGARDVITNATNFAVPTVANGKVYVGSANQLTVFGLFNANYPATPPQADHFLVTGPVNYWASVALSQSIGGIAIGVNQKQTVHFMITAIGPDEMPVKISGPVTVYYRDLDTYQLHPMGTLNFNNSAYGIMPYAFMNINNSGYDIYVSDGHGHTSVQPDATHPFFEELSTSLSMNDLGLEYPPLFVVGTNTRGLDHLVITVPSTVKDGDSAVVLVKVVTSAGVAIPVSGSLPIYDALPPGIGPDGNPVPIQQFDNQPSGPSGFAYEGLNYYDPAIFFPFDNPFNVTFNGVNGIVRYPLHGVGQHIIIISGGTLTGTAIVNVVP